jgi:hypothetical protein
MIDTVCMQTLSQVLTAEFSIKSTFSSLHGRFVARLTLKVFNEKLLF